MFSYIIYTQISHRGFCHQNAVSYAFSKS